MIGLAGIYPQNWPRVCAALNTVADPPPSGRASRPGTPMANAGGGDGDHSAAQLANAGTFLSEAESRDDCYRSYYAALAEMARR